MLQLLLAFIGECYIVGNNIYHIISQASNCYWLFSVAILYLKVIVKLKQLQKYNLLVKIAIFTQRAIGINKQVV